MLNFQALFRQIFNAQRIAERLRHGLKFQNFLGVRLFVDTMQRSDAARFKVARHRLVRRQHEFFDQAVRDVAFAAHDANHLSGVVEFDHWLGQIEIDGTEPRPPCRQNHGKIAHVPEMFGEVRVLRGDDRIILKHGIHRGVRHALRRTNHSARKIRSHQFAIRVQFHHRAHHQPIFPRIERADAVRQFLRQHGHGAIWKINGGAAQPRFAIQRRAAPHVMRNVGNVHLQLPVAVLQAPYVHSIVEIARRFPVNRDNRQIRKSTRASRSASVTGCAPAAASANTSAENSCGKWCLRIRISTSTPNSPGRPRISITRPAGATPPRGKRVISTFTTAPSSSGKRTPRRGGCAPSFPLQFRRQFIARRNNNFLQQPRFVGRHRIAARTVAK